MQDQLISHYHCLSHAGIKATQKFLQQHCVFTRMNACIHDLVKSCVSCQRAKVGRYVISPLTSTAMPTKRFNHIQVDMCGPFPTFQSFSSLFICTDRFTRWVEAYTMPDQSASSAIAALGIHVQIFGTFSIIILIVDANLLLLCSRTTAAF